MKVRTGSAKNRNFGRLYKICFIRPNSIPFADNESKYEDLLIKLIKMRTKISFQ
jgi:hypothetical protein